MRAFFSSRLALNQGDSATRAKTLDGASNRIAVQIDPRMP
jgi:hypothetical protein